MTDSRGTKPQPWNINPAYLSREAQRLWHGLIYLVPAWEGGGAPVDAVRGTVATVTGTQTWEQAGRGIQLRSGDLATNNGGWSFPNPVEGLPTLGMTVVIHKHKLDVTNRASGGFGVNSATAAHRCGTHLPFSDGTVYWDFGGTSSGVSRLSASGLTFGDDFWAFSAGERGMDIWQNGYQRNSQPGHVARTETGLTFNFGNGNSTGGTQKADNADFAFLAVWDHQLAPSDCEMLTRDPWMMIRFDPPRVQRPVSSAVVTGTATSAITEADVVAGGKTIIITLTNDTWVTAGATFNAIRQDIINGLDSAQSEGTGWNAVVRDAEVVGAVVRTSDTVVTITLSAAATYNITAPETITVTVPGSAVSGTNAITATPTFGVDIVTASHNSLLLLGVG